MGGQDPSYCPTPVALSCETCSMAFDSQEALTSHLSGDKHQKAGNATEILVCTICRVRVYDSSAWRSHINGSQHAKRAKRAGVSPHVEPVAPGPDLPGNKLCVACNRYMRDRSWKRHLASDSHRARVKFVQYHTALDEAEKDKDGVSIAGDFDFGVVELAAAKDGVAVNGTITYGVSSSKVTLVSYSLASSNGSRDFSPFSVDAKGVGRVLSSHAPIFFKVIARQAHLGTTGDRLDFLFEAVKLKRRFLISRSLRIVVGNQADLDLLKPKSRYQPLKRTERHPETSVVEGDSPPALTAIPYVKKLPSFTIPKDLHNVLTNGTVGEVLRQVRRAHLPPNFDSDTYARWFKVLLWIEEVRMDEDLHRYDIENAVVSADKRYTYLPVPGLAEKRPSVLVGDRILMRRPNGQTGHWFEGRVHVVQRDQVALRFHRSFPGAAHRYHVRFKLNRLPMRRQHLGMDTAFTQDRLLFPSMEHLPDGKFTFYPSNKIKISFYNPLVGANPGQKQAVVSILHQAAGSLPFLVFGPPGTGKTVTIVEAILQLLRKDPNARILACAPSNSAADIIASRLTSLSTSTLFRAYAPSRAKDQVSPQLVPYTHKNADGHFSVPSMKEMRAFRVVVSTCVSASMISGIGISRGYYSHIFVDEAGHATEPEVMVAIKTMAGSKTNVVLSGDPKQLGPIIRSTIARELGLEKSFIERLMEREVYDEREGYAATVVKLTKNYRSHKDILFFPNERFYRGDLECCGDSKVISMYLRSSHVINPAFPIVFYTVTGKDDREASSPSFFNSSEATQVKTIIEALRSDRKIKISHDDIGVISPYHAQCLKIRALLRPIAEGVKVGSVEEFQGQERKVIIISTVRSSMEFVEYDLKHTLGFVASPRRFNVAVTRAKALLIIVGNPNVLSLDPLWRSFLNYIYNNDGWKGPAPSWDTEEAVDEAGGYDAQRRDDAQFDMNEFTRAMEDMTIAGLEDDAAVDRPWNDNE